MTASDRWRWRRSEHEYAAGVGWYAWGDRRTVYAEAFGPRVDGSWTWDVTIAGRLSASGEAASLDKAKAAVRRLIRRAAKLLAPHRKVRPLRPVRKSTTP